MGLKVRDEQGILHDIAGMPTVDSFMSETSSNPVKNKTIYLALQDKVGKSVNNLVNYWNKTDSYSKEEVNALIGQISSMTIEVVATLPTTGISDTTIYWVGPDSETGLYDQYIHSNNSWIKTGDTSINLGDYLTIAAFNATIADYYTQTEIDTMVDNFYTKTEANALLDAKQDTLTFDNAPTENSTNPVKSGGVYTAINGKQDAFQVQTLGTASASNLGKIYEYLGSDTASLKHGQFYEAKEVIPITDPATYEWVNVPVQNIDNVTIVRSSSTGALSAVIATNNTLGVVKSGTNSDIAQDGSLNVVGVLKETDSSLGDASEHVGESYLYKGATTSSFRKGGIYQSIATEVTPEGTENPSQEGWYVLDDGEYVLTSDSQVESGTTYYTIEWILISANSTSFNENDFDISGDSVSLDPSQRIFVGTKAQWTAEQHKSSYSIVNLTDDELSPNSFVDWKSNSELGVHNLLDVNRPSNEIAGLTFTVNSDKSVTVNGTSTASWNFRLHDVFVLKAGTYILSSGIGANSEIYVQLVNPTETTAIAQTSVEGEKTFTLPSDTSMIARIFYKTGNTFTNLRIYPMIRLVRDNDNIYQPYAMTNKEMTPYVQTISNPNLFDNPWFTVNQRGFSSKTITAQQYYYGVDRWRVISNSSAGDYTVTLNSNNTITISNDDNQGEVYFEQIFENDKFEKEAVYTLSIMLSDGTILKGTNKLPTGNVGDTIKTFISFTGGSFYIYHPNTTGYYYVTINRNSGSMTIKAVKLEKGTVSTLAMDAKPNYQQELAKCQRYFYRLGKLDSNGSGYELSISNAFMTNSIWFVLRTPVPMRGLPTINVNGNLIITSSNTSNAEVNDVNGLALMSTVGMMGNITDISVAPITETALPADTLQVGKTYMLRTSAGVLSPIYIDLSADL